MYFIILIFSSESFIASVKILCTISFLLSTIWHFKNHKCMLINQWLKMKYKFKLINATLLNVPQNRNSKTSLSIVNMRSTEKRFFICADWFTENMIRKYSISTSIGCCFIKVFIKIFLKKFRKLLGKKPCLKT